MKDILLDSKLQKYKQGETQVISNDGYIDIPIELSVYFDSENYTLISGSSIDATPVVIYVLNTNIERIGTDSDVDIITSMLERGYAVVILDYLNNEKSISPDLDWSVQGLRTKIKNGTYFSELGAFSSGTYINNMVVPAGYNIEFSLVFWEIDKHGADGTFDKIVEVWNNDFRGYKGNIVIKWTDKNGNRKSTQNGFDGSKPIWYSDAAGTIEDAENGTYIKIKHTLANDISDCVKQDGMPIDLNLYMHITYPTNPGYDVPVMALACSSEHLAGGTQTSDRPQLNGFLFNGYVAVTYDYGYTPMARTDHYGYFDGSTPSKGSVTGDNVTYSIQWYNESKINTAAMRFLRYLSASDHDTYSFNSESIGVYGNSKGGWMTLLGEEHPEHLPERRIVPEHSGETRYENGDTDDNGYIDGGEEQPWLTYNGVVLDSGADFIYASCGGGSEQITSSHCPTFVSCNKFDGSCYNSSNQFVNVCRNMDIPALWFEVNQGHTFAYENDVKYNVNAYEALFTFAGYHLKGDAVSVIYILRDAEYSGMPTNAPIVIKFSGAVAIEEIEKITLTNANGKSVNGVWNSSFGGTEWTFTTPTLEGSTSYTLTIPSDLKGDNGKSIGKATTYTFETGYEVSMDASLISNTTTANGTYVYFNVPDVSDIEFNANVYTLRLNITNDAVNTLKIYSLSGFDPNTPDNATIDKLLGTINISGSGQYDVDLSEKLNEMSIGETAAFLIKEKKSAGNTIVSASTLDGSLGDISVSGSVSYSFDDAPDGITALKLGETSLSSSASNNSYYTNPLTLFANNNIIQKSTLTEDDLGRRFVISLKIYDTVSRIVTVKLSNGTSSSKNNSDYNAYFYNVYTKANEWITFEFEYTVYEPTMYEALGYYIRQQLSVSAPRWGNKDNVIYISDVIATEVVTNVTLSNAELLTTSTRTACISTEI